MTILSLAVFVVLLLVAGYFTIGRATLTKAAEKADWSRISKEYDQSGDEEKAYVRLDNERIEKISELAKEFPAFLNEPVVYAQMVEHLSGNGSYRFDLILDPEAFQKEYMEKYNAEDPAQERTTSASLLHDFGVPDFSQLKLPEIVDGTLIYYAENTHMGVPYKVTYVIGQEKPDYTPVAMVQ